jgi:hypothetical protein
MGKLVESRRKLKVVKAVAGFGGSLSNKRSTRSEKEERRREMFDGAGGACRVLPWFGLLGYT